MTLDDINITMLTFDSLLCGLTFFVVWSIIRNASALHSNFKNYVFGSDKWWNYIEHILIVLIALIGSLGLAFSLMMHTFEQNYTHVYCDSWEVPIELSNMVLLLSILLVVKHISNEAKRDLNSKEKS